ncbi:MAG: branched-chain amino acid ABC transporter permease [Clostridiales bacterium]|nr:branched-chain amino acid ABC transporter permease [Clostridiales bacterium]
MKDKMRKMPTWLSYLINAAFLFLILFGGMQIINSGRLSTYYIRVIILCGINIILALSLNLATGFLGQLPLGHAGFMALGAYSSAIFMRFACNVKMLPPTLMFPVGIVLGGVFAAFIGFLIGIPALRLKGDYLAIITLGFGEIIRVVLLNIDDVLGFKLTYGAASLKNIPKTTNFFNTFLLVGITYYVIHTYIKSRHGRATLAIRDNEIAAESCGINTTYYKTLGFTMSAFFAGIAGALYAGYLGVINPSGFGFMKSIEILVTVVLGGMGSMVGSIISATVLTAVPEMLRAFSQYRMIVYSLLLVVVMIFKPSGLMGNYEFSLTKILNKSGSKKKNKKGGGKNG